MPLSIIPRARFHRPDISHGSGLRVRLQLRYSYDSLMSSLKCAGKGSCLDMGLADLEKEERSWGHAGSQLHSKAMSGFDGVHVHSLFSFLWPIRPSIFVLISLISLSRSSCAC